MSTKPSNKLWQSDNFSVSARIALRNIGSAMRWHMLDHVPGQYRWCEFCRTFAS